MTMQSTGEDLLDSASTAVQGGAAGARESLADALSDAKERLSPTIEAALSRARTEIAPRLDGLADTIDQITPDHVAAVVAVPVAGLSHRLRRSAAAVRPAPTPRRWVWVVGLVAAGAAGAYAVRTIRARRAADDSWADDAAFGPSVGHGVGHAVGDARAHAAEVNDVKLHDPNLHAANDPANETVVDMRAKAADTLAKAAARVSDTGEKTSNADDS